MDKLITVATFFDPSEAYILKGLLESNGIDAWLFDERAAAYTPFVVGGIKLAVREPDLEKAQNIISLKD